MQYFLGIEIARSKREISVSQCKYVLDFFPKTGMLGYKRNDTPIEFRNKYEDLGEILTYKDIKHLWGN